MMSASSCMLRPHPLATQITKIFYSTLIHASLVLVPILGVTWVLGFLVVGNGVYATVVEWLFFAFTTLQGVAIFLAHCVLNREASVCCV